MLGGGPIGPLPRFSIENATSCEIDRTKIRSPQKLSLVGTADIEIRYDSPILSNRNSVMVNSIMTQPLEETARFDHSNRRQLWIDGVGSFLLCLEDQVTIGGPAFGSDGADISLLASLSRCHATVLRIGDDYLVEPHSVTALDERTLFERTHLADQNVLGLGRNVKLRFRLPSVLSNSACLEFVSQHRPHFSVDGIVLMDDTCLLGPGTDHHVKCPRWNESLVLFRRDGLIWCKSPQPLKVNDTPLVGTGPVPDGAIVTGPEIRFRIEPVE